MWIILIDHSSSMGDPFSGKQTFAGRTTKSKANSKLEAAIDAILERLPGRAPEEQVAIIGFTSKAHLLVEGNGRELNRFKTVLEQLTATNGTDIAAGLEKANDYLQEHPSVTFSTLLLVTDGQSDAASAIRAKEKLVGKIVQLSAILIDPTEQAEELLRGLLLNGEIQGVTSASDLKKNVGSIDDKQKEFAQEVEKAYEKLVAKENLALTVRDKSDGISFSAAYPKLLTPENWTPLLFYIHASSLSEHITRLLRERAGELFLHPAIAQNKSTTTIPLGTELTITPNLPGLRTNPREIRITWEEDIHDLIIKIKADSHLVGKRIQGSIDIYVDGALIGDVAVSLTISDGKQGDIVEKSSVSEGKLYRRVFVSYSRKDIDVVKACLKTYEALGIYVSWDKQELRNLSGEAWKVALKKFISESNVFQLYWSHRSSKSEWVEMEWQHALANTGQNGQRFIRPLVWEDDFPELPTALADLQLGFLDLEIWRSVLEKKDAKLVPVTTSIVEAVVIPILSGTPQSTVNSVRADISYAIQFLEKTTGLRYYPVPTLLVDEFIVKSVRKELVVDIPPPGAKESAPEQAIHLAEIVQSIALAFHVRFRDNFPEKHDQFDEVFGKGNLFSKDLFDNIRGYCEYIINRLVLESPAIAEMRLRKLLDKAQDLNAPLPSIIRQLVQIIVDNVNSGNYKSIGYTLHSLSKEEYESIKEDLSNAGISVYKDKYIDKERYVLDVKSSIPYINLAGNFIDEIEIIIQKFVQNFEEPLTLDLRTRTLGRLISNGLKHPNLDIEKALSDLVSAAYNPSWRGVLNELVSLDNHLFSPNMGFVEMLQQFLILIIRTLREGAKKYGDHFIKIDYSVSKKSWEVCEKLLNSSNIIVEANKESWNKEDSVFISGSLIQIIDFFEEITEELTRVLGKPIPVYVDRFFAVEAPTFGIFTQQGNLSIDEKLRRWARDAGTPPEFTLPGVSRVLLCLNALSRFRETLRQRNMPVTDAARFQRSVMIHEHFHAIVAGGINPDDGRLPQGPRTRELWNKASPVNESLAAWMQLHDSRDNPEIWKHVMAHITMGKYPEWPYAGALALEKAYQDKGLSEIQKWVTSLRNAPEESLLSFNDLVGQYASE